MGGCRKLRGGEVGRGYVKILNGLEYVRKGGMGGSLLKLGWRKRIWGSV
jgi:hypothetical protein